MGKAWKIGRSPKGREEGNCLEFWLNGFVENAIKFIGSPSLIHLDLFGGKKGRGSGLNGGIATQSLSSQR